MLKPLKPVVVAGFSIFVTASVLAQDYIDVEAEREAARRAKQFSEATEQQAQPTSVDASASEAPVASEPYSVPGIRPYSGQTTVAPVQSTGRFSAAASDAGGAMNVGSLVIQLQQLQEEVRRLNGIVEEQSEDIQRLKEQSLERYVDIDRRLADLGSSDRSDINSSAPSRQDELSFGGVAGGPAQATRDTKAGPVSSVPEQAGEKAAYQGAYDLVKARDFPAAVEAFRDFLGGYPFGHYAPNAHYWLGELYLVIDPPDPELARQSFKMLLDQYPENPKVPDALYKLGRVHFLKGNLERSMDYLNRVIQGYEGHPAAQLAQDFIDQNF